MSQQKLQQDEENGILNEMEGIKLKMAILEVKKWNNLQIIGK
jgi:hypothetical protein